MSYTAKFTLAQGSREIEITNITGWEFGEGREPSPNGMLGMRGHMLDRIVIERDSSQTIGEEMQLDGKLADLAAALGEKAYFAGEITHSPPDDEANVTDKLAWEQGHITRHRRRYRDGQVQEILEISAPAFYFNDSQFEQRVGN